MAYLDENGLTRLWAKIKGLFAGDFSTTTYTEFDGSVVSDGTVVVVQKLGWCQVFGVVTLTDTVASWTTILDSVKVPAPQHGRAIYQTITGWGTSYVRPARVRITPSGGLAVRYGAAFELNFSFAYPIAA